ncbi:hypothetical protein EDD18DRAFT_1116315 [Armillaria luteobubalina]|uniref:Uncharacterized protein n=1 Tax=Armillaria luteobubalina TaxID=153913 RepID=A0AA39NZY9_9AGAR|nr:hypothetical protein EDD18DRAFT_1116315 [Armillaria luteobubalina]
MLAQNLFPVAIFQAPRNHRGFGHWAVKFDDPRRKSLRKDFQDKAGMRGQSLKDSPRMGKYRPTWDHWREMCSTTPAVLTAINSIIPIAGTFNGVWDVWFVKDESC